MLKRILSLSIKEFIHLKNDWWLPAFMLIGGMLELLLVGWATSRPIENLPAVILDQDISPQSREVITALQNTGAFDFKQQVFDFNHIEEMMMQGEINMAVIIPQDFSQQLNLLDGQAQLVILLNGAESVPALAALRAVEGSVSAISENIIVDRLKLDPSEFDGFDPSIRVWFNEALSEAYYTTPAELGLMLEFTVLLFAALSFSRERELGTLEQLLVMPFSSFEIIVGKMLPVILIGFVDFSLMLSMVHLAFGVPIRGSLGLLLLIAFGYIFVELGKGLVLSVLSRTQHQAFLLVMVVGMTDFLFTGYAAPVESMPEVIRLFANFIPAYHWLTILRGILLKGSGLAVLWPNLLALFVLGVGIMGFSLRYVRRALN